MVLLYCLVVQQLFVSLVLADDDCSGLCGRGTICSPTEHYCKCQPGFKDRLERNGTFTCVTDIDECALDTYYCPQNSTCQNLPGSYTCKCSPGLYITDTGYCLPDVDECSLGLSDCRENSICLNTLGSYVCQCLSGFIRIDNGTCIEINQSGDGGYWWVGVTVFAIFFIVLAACSYFFYRQREDDKASTVDNLSEDRLSRDELRVSSINIQEEEKVEKQSSSKDISLLGESIKPDNGLLTAQEHVRDGGSDRQQVVVELQPFHYEYAHSVT